MHSALDRALGRRATLLGSLHAEGTTCYRLLHGSTEGAPGCTADRYGPILLVQTWRDPLEPGEVDALDAVVGGAIPGLVPVYNHRAPSRRRGATPDFARWHDPEIPADPVGTELGLRYDVRPRHRGADPLLFVDLRAGRRRVRAEAAGCSVLNLFCYTAGLGIAAMAGGASEVLNLDFSASALEVGARNAALNGVDGPAFRLVRANALPAVRQLAGKSPGGRRGRRPRFVRFEARRFDLVLLDPPRFAATPFGAVDVVRDYPGLLKPALLATAPGGHLLATNHVPAVSWEDWTAVLRRTADKAGRPLRALERIEPEADIPSPDGRWPLKIAWLSV
jgi:23S rRNA (cytosine1962-C5)-methyltransferase